MTRGTVKLPKLGVGVVYIPGLEPLLELGNAHIDVLEVEPQTFWRRTGDGDHPYFIPQDALGALQRLPQTKIIHSVGFTVGGTQVPDDALSKALVETASALDAVWISDHLAVTHVASKGTTFNAGFMLSPLHTSIGARRAAQTISRRSKQLPLPFAVETPVNYLRPRRGELSDGELVAQVVDQADCGIVLDLHNVWTNEQNGRQSVASFLDQIPLERVWEVHVAGGFQFGDYWLDAHSGPVPEPVLEWLEEILPALPNASALIYELFPSFLPVFGLDRIERQLQRLNDIWERALRTPVQPEAAPLSVHPEDPAPQTVGDEVAPEVWEATLGELVTHGSATGPLAEELTRDPGVPLIRRLVWRFRAGAITKALGALTKLVLIAAGSSQLETLLDRFIRSSKPRPFASEEASHFLSFVRQEQPKIPFLEDVLRYEEAVLKAEGTRHPQYVAFAYEPLALLQALIDGRLPIDLERGRFELEVPPSSAHGTAVSGG